MNRCPLHPDQDTMVPCLECGRYFCRVCDPPSGAGQYCPRCYRQSLAELEEKRGPRMAGVRGLFEAKERKEKPVKPGAGIRRGPSAISQFADKAKSAVATVPGLPARVVSLAERAFREHFPLVIGRVEKYGGEPPLRKCWYKLLAVVLSGAASWTLIAAWTHHRWAWVSIVVAFLVAAGTVWSLGTRFGLMVGLFAMALALLSLATGEVLVQALYRYGVIKSLDLPRIVLSQAGYAGNVYRSFVVNVVVLRFLPSAAVAFMVGWWPIPKRLGWRGFRISG